MKTKYILTRDIKGKYALWPISYSLTRINGEWHEIDGNYVPCRSADFESAINDYLKAEIPEIEKGALVEIEVITTCVVV